MQAVSFSLTKVVASKTVLERMSSSVCNQSTPLKFYGVLAPFVKLVMLLFKYILHLIKASHPQKAKMTKSAG